ncbi:MAG: hypothetical protein DRQ56_04755 [Gammaproteobacteria bacterium]|nr:MAG: hypothetical protein DRQ56_04755 [Gammaproteobacteria bacterium]
MKCSTKPTVGNCCPSSIELEDASGFAIRVALIKQVQELVARYPGSGINPDKFFLLTTSEIAGILAYLKCIHANKSG